MNTSSQISKKAFITSLCILLGLMIFSWILTQIIMQGQFDRIMVDGVESIVANTYQPLDTIRLPFYRILTAPFEVFIGSEGLSVLVIILFIMIIGGSFNVLNQIGIIESSIHQITRQFIDKKYQLLMILIFVFMLFGSAFGLLEELIPLVPVMIILSNQLGFDELVGIGISGLAAGFGFASATFNPFTLGIAQKLAGLPLFSGLLFRVFVFIVSYIILTIFIIRYAKKIENKSMSDLPKIEINPKLKKSIQVLKITGIFLGFSIVVTSTQSYLADLSVPFIAIIFLVGTLFASSKIQTYQCTFKQLGQGIIGILPGAVLIILAMSIKVIITNGQILDTILYQTSLMIQSSGQLWAIISIYLLVLILNFFIGSGSAKAFLVIPIIAPLASLVGISRQIAVQAFLFGDGYSNLIYPTNALLMIILGLGMVSYTKWFKWTFKLQLLMVIVSIGLLLVAQFIGYGPF